MTTGRSLRAELFVGSALVLLLNACCRCPAPLPAPQCPEPAPPPKVEAPPEPPRCDSLEVPCLAEPDQPVSIGNSGAEVVFPPGWSYAKLGEIALAVSADKKAVLGFASRDAAADEPVPTTLERLLNQLGVEDIRWPRIKQRLNRPESELEGTHGVELALWEVDAKSQWGKKPKLRDQGTGTLLVIVATLPNEAVMVGAGFVVKPEAEAEAPAIMTAVQSLRVTP